MVLVVKNPPANTGDIRDVGSIRRSGRFPGGGHGNSLRYSCPENPMSRGSWWATVHRVAKSQTRLKRLHACTDPRNMMSDFMGGAWMLVGVGGWFIFLLFLLEYS